MATGGETNRIKFALMSTTWTYEQDDPAGLRAKSTRVLPSEYAPHMAGHLFCPVCFTPLSRTPKVKPLFSNGRRACFAHLPSYAQVTCELRSTKPEGLNFLSEEEAKEAIANAELVVVSSFMNEPPEAALSSGIYDQSDVEDAAGPLTEVAIARHTGDLFRLPSRLSTVSSICRNFDLNLYRYYCLPGNPSPERLVNVLTPISEVVATDDTQRLYWGVIKNSFVAGEYPKPIHLRMTELRCNGAVKDFYLKDIDANQTLKGISDSSVGRIVLFWGRITESGIGLCVARPGWGEYALLPQKYNELLLDREV